MTPAAVGFHCPECVNEGRRSIRPTRTVYGGKVRRTGIDATRVLIAINVVVFLLTVLSGANVLSGTGTSKVYDDFALVPALVAHGESYRLVSAMFLHFGIWHIALNMAALYVIGTPLEMLLGRLRFVALYFLAGLGGSLLSFAAGSPTEIAAGASGAIFGLFGALYVLTRRRGLETGGIAGIIVINLIFSFTFSNIDWRGHVGGLIVGTIVAAVFAYSPSTPPRREQVQALGCLAVAVVLAALGLAVAPHVHSQCPNPAIVHFQNATGVACGP
jgi:membrane associated rhomboid family serine protease